MKYFPGFPIYKCIFYFFQSLPKSENVESDLQKASLEVILLREEESKLRQENLQLKVSMFVCIYTHKKFLTPIILLFFVSYFCILMVVQFSHFSIEFVFHANVSIFLGCATRIIFSRKNLQ